MKSLKKRLKKKGYVPVKLKKIYMPDTRAYHLAVKARINGKKGWFIVDSGASTTVIHQAKKEYFKLRPPKEQPDFQAWGASPEELDMVLAGEYPVKIKKWKGGKFLVMLMDLSHINMAFHPLGPVIDGIIGADVLDAGRAVLDYGSRTLYLRKKSGKKS